jgi:RNA polymerase-binding protein DksA
MLSKAERDFYRQRLLHLLGRLSKDRSQLKDEALQPEGGEASGGLSDVPLHLADLGTHQSEEDLTLTLIENEEQIIEEINGALERIEKGTFGRCEVCDRKIPRERLQALPYARHCVRCARKIQEDDKVTR